MPMLDVKYPGVAYGQAQMTEAGQPGQLVRMTGHDQLSSQGTLSTQLVQFLGGRSEVRSFK